MEIQLIYDENADNKITELYFNKSKTNTLLNNVQFETIGLSNLILFDFNNVEKENSSIKCHVKKQKDLFIISFSQIELNKYISKYAIINTVEIIYGDSNYELRFDTNIQYTFATNQIST